MGSTSPTGSSDSLPRRPTAIRRKNDSCIPNGRTPPPPPRLARTPSPLGQSATDESSAHSHSITSSSVSKMAAMRSRYAARWTGFRSPPAQHSSTSKAVSERTRPPVSAPRCSGRTSRGRCRGRDRNSPSSCSSSDDDELSSSSSSSLDTSCRPPGLRRRRTRQTELLRPRPRRRLRPSGVGPRFRRGVPAARSESCGTMPAVRCGRG